MPRYRLTLEYDGAPFVGWQRQDSGLGVQAVLETAVKNLSGEDALVYGAGRTDSGVHATWISPRNSQATKFATR